jgi:hypothetical protein
MLSWLAFFINTLIWELCFLRGLARQNPKPCVQAQQQFQRAMDGAKGSYRRRSTYDFLLHVRMLSSAAAWRLGVHNQDLETSKFSLRALPSGKVPGDLCMLNPFSHWGLHREPTASTPDKLLYQTTSLLVPRNSPHFLCFCRLAGYNGYTRQRSFRAAAPPSVELPTNVTSRQQIHFLLVTPSARATTTIINHQRTYPGCCAQRSNKHATRELSPAFAGPLAPKS